MNTTGNLYADLMFESFDLFEEARLESLKLMEQDRKSEVRDCWSKVIDITKQATVVSSYEEFHLESAEKTAVIVMGLSCSGKTTIARVLAEQYPGYEIISFDRIGMELAEVNLFKYVLFPNELDNDIIIHMGELIENYSTNNRNLIIEGEYASLNARGALIKTLKTLGYEKICLISTLTLSAEVQRTFAEKRALTYVYADTLDKDAKNELMYRSFSEDVVPEIESKVDAEEIKRQDAFEHYLLDMEMCRRNEFLSDMIPIQFQLDFILAGADLFADWF